MKVKELIEKLSKFDKEKQAVILFCDENPILDSGRGIDKVYEIKGIEDDCVFIQEI